MRHSNGAHWGRFVRTIVELETDVGIIGLGEMGGGGESAEARAVAGEELENIAFERFKEVALGIERALARLPKDSPALTELPYLLAEVAEPRRQHRQPIGAHPVIISKKDLHRPTLPRAVLAKQPERGGSGGRIESAPPRGL